MSMIQPMTLRHFSTQPLASSPSPQGPVANSVHPMNMFLWRGGTTKSIPSSYARIKWLTWLTMTQRSTNTFQIIGNPSHLTFLVLLRLHGPSQTHFPIVQLAPTVHLGRSSKRHLQISLPIIPKTNLIMLASPCQRSVLDLRLLVLAVEIPTKFVEEIQPNLILNFLPSSLLWCGKTLSTYRKWRGGFCLIGTVFLAHMISLLLPVVMIVFCVFLLRRTMYILHNLMPQFQRTNVSFLLWHAPIWQLVWTKLLRHKPCGQATRFQWKSRRNSVQKQSTFLAWPFSWPWTIDSAFYLRKHWHDFISVLSPIQKPQFWELHGMLFENFLLLSIVSHNIIKATSTPTSSLESAWSNIQTDSALVSIKQYHSLQARFNEMQREHSNLVKQCELLSVKNSTLKYVSLYYKLEQLAHT